MTSNNGLCVESSVVHRLLFGLRQALLRPRSSLSWVVRGQLARDDVFVQQTYWSSGTLPRVSLADILPDARVMDVIVPRAFDRKSHTSINAVEACHLAAIARTLGSRRVLEIGTFDGNTTLLLAANIGDDGQVTTVDLPPDFDARKQGQLTYADCALNLTPRDQLGRQYRSHRYASRIRQVFGDSARVDWNGFGGPFDLVFIDGCHSAAYVRSDSENAMTHLAPKGVIVWHDYGMIGDVSRVVDRLAAERPTMSFYALEGTRLAIAVPRDRHDAA